MKKFIVLFVLLNYLSTTVIPVTSLAEEKFPNPPTRDLINWLDHWYRKGFSLERHIRYTCKQYEASKIGGASWIKEFQILESKQVDGVYYIRASYSGKGTTRYVHAKIKRQGDIWVNQEFIVSYAK